MLLKKHINLLLFTLLLGACNSVDRLHEYPITDDYILVDMNISAAIEQSDIPIPSSRNLHTSSSGLPDGVFAVNILYKGKAINNYQPYAAGLYDNPYSSMQIKLIAGYEYRFDCSFLSFSDISIIDQSNDTCFYGKPFALTTSESLPAYPTNKLLVSQPPYDNKTPYYSGIYKGASQVSVDSVSIQIGRAPCRERVYVLV